MTLLMEIQKISLLFIKRPVKELLATRKWAMHPLILITVINNFSKYNISNNVLFIRRRRQLLIILYLGEKLN